MGNSAKRDAEAFRLAERRSKGLKLRIGGISYDQIAKQLGYTDRSHASRDIKKAIYDTCPDEDRQLLRKIENARINALFAAAFPKALANDWKAHNACQAYDRALRELNGLDDSKRTELTGANGGPILTADVSALSDDQLERILSGDLAATASGGGAGEEAPGAGEGGSELD